MPKRLTPAGQAAPPVEPNVAQAHIPKKPAKKAPRKKPVITPDTKYVRNLHHIEARVTLTTGREIHLEPRGQREDVDIVTADEQEDPRFIANDGLIFEVIEVEEAREIIAKQQHNTKGQTSTLWDHLRNSQGKEYTQRVAQIEEAFERQGYVVGRVEETGAGRFTDKNSEIVRAAGPQIESVPGSPGHAATQRMLEEIPQEISPEDFHEFLLWKKFMQQKAQNESIES